MQVSEQIWPLSSHAGGTEARSSLRLLIGDRQFICGHGRSSLLSQTPPPDLGYITTCIMLRLQVSAEMMRQETIFFHES